MKLYQLCPIYTHALMDFGLKRSRVRNSAVLIKSAPRTCPTQDPSTLTQLTNFPVTHAEPLPYLTPPPFPSSPSDAPLARNTAVAPTPASQAAVPEIPFPSTRPKVLVPKLSDLCQTVILTVAHMSSSTRKGIPDARHNRWRFLQGHGQRRTHSKSFACFPRQFWQSIPTPGTGPRQK